MINKMKALWQRHQERAQVRALLAYTSGSVRDDIVMIAQRQGVR